MEQNLPDDKIHEGDRKIEDKARLTIGVVDDILMKDTTKHTRYSFEENVLESIKDLQHAQKKSEEKRQQFEACIIKKIDAFADYMKQMQGRTQNRGQKQHMKVEPARSRGGRRRQPRRSPPKKYLKKTSPPPKH